MSFSGTYDITIDTPMGKQEGKLVIEHAGDELTGTMSAQGDETAIKNGKVDGDTATWDVDVTKPMPLTLSFSGTASETGLSGSVQLGAFGQSTFVAVSA